MLLVKPKLVMKAELSVSGRPGHTRDADATKVFNYVDIRPQIYYFSIFFSYLNQGGKTKEASFDLCSWSVE